MFHWLWITAKSFNVVVVGHRLLVWASLHLALHLLRVGIEISLWSHRMLDLIFIPMPKINMEDYNSELDLQRTYSDFFGSKGVVSFVDEGSRPISWRDAYQKWQKVISIITLLKNYYFFLATCLLSCFSFLCSITSACCWIAEDSSSVSWRDVRG